MIEEYFYVNRELELEISKYMDRKEIIAVLGARQCGKTTMLNKITSKLKNVNSITFEDVKTLELFKNDIDSFIEIHVKGFDFLYIDEIQYAKESGKNLKYIYDTHKIKIFITGSSAAEISIQSLKYLVGRILIFELYSFSFGEFLEAKDSKLYNLYNSGEYKDEIREELNKYLEEYLTYGGYPAVIFSKNKEEKIVTLKNIYNTFLLKEIREILQLSENDKLIYLMESLSLQIGNLLNYNELSNISKTNFGQLNQYFKILEETFICKRIRPFYNNKRTELVNVQKIYFYDLGFRNICVNNFNINGSDKGQLYENFVFSELIKINKNLKYWRSQNGAEVDFIINDKIPLEVKSTLIDNRLEKSLFSFVEKYKPKNGFILSKNFEGKKKIENTNIKFLPFVKLNQIDFQ